jgi:hypothetical protein
MTSTQLAIRRELSLAAALVLAVFAPALVLAQDHGAANAISHGQHQTPAEARQLNALVETVRGATERFRDPAIAEAEGYHLMFGCVSGGDYGAMGLHYVKGALIGDAVLDPTQPEIVIYEPGPDGRLRLVGADFLVFKDVWDAAYPSAPQLMGQLLHLFDAPNRFGLPAFYTLHVWAWKHNPNGAFVNWHPHVSCDAFADAGGVPPDPGPDGAMTQLLRKDGSRRDD